MGLLSKKSLEVFYLVEERGFKKTLRDIYKKLVEIYTSIVSIDGKTKSDVPPALAGLNLTEAQINGIERGYTLGHNTSVDNANLQDVTNFGEDYITLPTTLTSMQVVSDSAEDGAGGNTGAQQVTIHGLDNNFDRKTQTVILNGTTPVTVDDAAAAIEFRRINHVNVSGVAPTNTQHTAVGNITVETLSTGALTYGLVEAGGNMELAMRATVPNGFTGYIENWSASVGDMPNNGDEVTILLRATCDPVDRTILTNLFIFQDVMHLATSNQEHNLAPALAIPEKADIKISSQLNGGNGTTIVSGSAQMWLVPDA